MYLHDAVYARACERACVCVCVSVILTARTPGFARCSSLPRPRVRPASSPARDGGTDKIRGYGFSMQSHVAQSIQVLCSQA